MAHPASAALTRNLDIELRPVRAEDYRFAWRLYSEGIRPYAAAYQPWVDAEAEARFASRYKAQSTWIIRRGGVDIGWMELHEVDEELRLNQLYVAAAHRRNGIGSEVMQHVLARSRETGKPVLLNVLKNNPARRLYERFGFTVSGESETKFFMTRPAER
jgi:ribosomal protein S18 acetylase RimI-like enzyme